MKTILFLISFLIVNIVLLGQEDVMVGYIKDSIGGYSESIASDRYGNIYLTGVTQTNGIEGVEFSALSSDGFLAKLSPEGQTLWVRRMGGEGSNISEETTQLFVYDDVIYVYGSYKDSMNFSNDCSWDSTTLYTDTIFTDTGYYKEDFGKFLAKYHEDGSLLWRIRMPLKVGNSRLNMSSTHDALYLCGYFYDSINFNSLYSSWDINTLNTISSSSDMFIAKYSHDGAFIWAKRFGGLGKDYVYEMSIANDFMYVTGEFTDSSNFTWPFQAGQNEIHSKGDEDIFLAKFDLEGNVLWAKRMGSDEYDYVAGLEVLDNEIYLSGRMDGIGDFNTPSDVNNGYLVTGNQFLAKFTENGDLIWCFESGGDPKLITSNESGIYISGEFEDSLRILNTNKELVKVIGSEGDIDMFLYKCTHDGELLWAKRGGGEKVDYPRGLCVSDNKVYVYGEFSSYGGGQYVNFNTPSAWGSNEVYCWWSKPLLIQYVESQAGLEETHFTPNKRENWAYPNPNLGEYILSIPPNVEKYTLEIKSIDGKDISYKKIEISDEQVLIQMDGSIKNGVYIITIISDLGERYVTRIIVDKP
jgi:hypothetical protein